MKQTAVVVAPGRGTYNREELGYFARHHPDKSDLLDSFDSQRRALGQVSLADLDGADRFSGAQYTRGDNASALIYACAIADFQSINQDKFDIVAVTGNSMGWYIALACAGVLTPSQGHSVVNTMGTLMHEHMIGGQIIYPFVNERWEPIQEARHRIEAKVLEVNARPNHQLALSIDLGGMLVLAGDEAGLQAFEAEMPSVQGRFPMRLPGHAGFHTSMQQPVAELGQKRLLPDLFGDPVLSLVDGRGAIWRKKSDLTDLHSYTFGHQVVAPYHFSQAICVAAREFMPDVFIVLGPGNTLGGSVAQSLLAANWRGMRNKDDFQKMQAQLPRLLAMGHPDQRSLVI